jgi:NAD(P)-dependent dehydrogenase (short-subunit alcohol dehydrogenase family)
MSAKPASSGPLSGKTILVTGASSGLGRAIALELASRDNALVVTARRKELLESLAVQVRARGSRCLVAPADATDPVAAAAVIDAAIARFGRIDVALLNAGGAAVQVMGEREADAPAVLATMRKNYDSLVSFLCPLIEHMREAGGAIAYTGSPAGSFGLPKSGPYSAAKAAGRVLFDTCRIELSHTPIRFIALYPGFTYTEGLVADEVPIRSLIIDKERAVREMLWAMERGRAHHMFPRRIRWPTGVALLLPEWARRSALSLVRRFDRPGA